MSNGMSETEEFHAVFRVKRIGLLTSRDLWKVELDCYAGSVLDVILYTNGGEPCPYSRDDFYTTDAGPRGGWSLTRLPQKDIDCLKQGIADWEILSPAEKARRTKDMRKTLSRLPLNRPEPASQEISTK